MIKKTTYVLLSLILFTSPFITGCQPKAGTEVTPLLESPSPGNTLYLFSNDPYTLDPAVTGEMTSHDYIMQIFSGLVRLDEEMRPVADIAEGWQISDDGRTYIFQLREDVRFHNGEEVKAEDFKYSWERACNPETLSQTAKTYLGDIVGVNDMLLGTSDEISGVKVSGDYTLEVTIDAPKAYFLYKLTYPTAFVVDKANIESGSEWWYQPNGTGPFRLREWDYETLLATDRQLTLEKNNLYYGNLPEISFVTFYLEGVPIRMYEAGEIDATGINVSDYYKATDEAGSFYQDLKVTPELSLFYIGFNTNKAPFDDANIRQAFSMAIDKDKLASLVFNDMVQPANGILPSGIPGFNEYLPGLGYDVNQAKNLISESTYGNTSRLPPITITTTGWGGLINQQLEAIITEWRNNLGIEVRVRQLEPERFLYYLSEEKNEMFYAGWIADYPHPQNFLAVLFQSGADNNHGEYTNPQVDELLNSASLELDSGRSLAIYRQAEEIMVADAACLPLWFGENYTLVKPYVKGYELTPQGTVMLNNISLDRE
ncbi:peptide ABC transporter substrate-binding protein [Chloroflexota bacterium]